jgi:hypothetical protein
VFGSTTSDGLVAAREAGVGVLNPVGGTFHPKLYLGRHGDRIAAAVGSANLTSGLVGNVEVVAVLTGRPRRRRCAGCGIWSRGGRIPERSTGHRQWSPLPGRRWRRRSWR